MNEDIDKNLKVKVFLDELDTNGTMEVDFKKFCVISEPRPTAFTHPEVLQYFKFSILIPDARIGRR